MQTRSFCYVDDLVDGLCRLMDGNDIGPINLGNPGEFTIRELAEKVIALTGSKSQLIEKPLPVDDPKQRRPDITKATKVLGFTPKILLADGLVPTIDHFRKVLGL
jgi:UDP-glucuronate decarboxylase